MEGGCVGNCLCKENVWTVELHEVFGTTEEEMIRPMDTSFTKLLVLV